MKFQLGDYAKIPRYEISRGIITGIEEHSNWIEENGEFNKIGNPEFDYKVTTFEEGQMYDAWYSEKWIEFFN